MSETRLMNVQHGINEGINNKSTEGEDEVDEETPKEDDDSSSSSDDSIDASKASSTSVDLKGEDEEDVEDDREEEQELSINSTSNSSKESANANKNGKGEKSRSRPQSSLAVPTATANSRKRKHIQTNFDTNSLLTQTMKNAQEEERKRLERLKDRKGEDGDHIQDIANLNPLPVIDLNDLDMQFNEDFLLPNRDDHVYSQGPSTSKAMKHEPEVIDLSSDDDEIQEIGSYPAPRAAIPNYSYSTGRGRNKWMTSDKERLALKQMDSQHKIEQDRLRRNVRLVQDFEQNDMSTGRLLVNARHPPEDPDIAVASHLTHVLQPHQLGGIRFMYENVVESVEAYKSSPGFGCILAHSMGLGKTLQVVTFTDVFFRATEAHKILVIVPVNTIQNWMNEYDKWMPKFTDSGEKGRNFEVFILGDAVKTFDQRVNLIEEWDNKGGVLLIGYDMFRLLIRSTKPPKKKPTRPKLNFLNGKIVREEETRDEPAFDEGYTTGGRFKKDAHSLVTRALLDPGPELVVCDEGHKIKNLNTDIAVSLGSIKTKRRVVLTGYPLQNNLMEYYCMVNFVRPQYLGEKQSFSILFEKPIKNGQCMDSTPGDVKLALQRTHVLVELLKGFVQRRTHHLLKTILPQCREYVLLVRKSPLQHALYRNFLIYANSEIRNGNTGQVFNPLKAFAACSKIWNHPDVLAKTLDRIKEKRKKEADEREKNAQDQIENLAPMQHQSLPGSSTSAGNMGSSFAPKTIFQALSRMGWGDPDLDILDEDEVRESGKRKKTRTLMDDLDINDEHSLKYDWAEILMDYYKKGDIENGYKMKLALEILDETTRRGEKMLLFSQNLSALDLVESFLAKRLLQTQSGQPEMWMRNKNYFRLDGSTSGSDREKLINKFNADENMRLFLISTRAGSLGINLVSANRCIILDACWNPCHDAQAVCRVYRYGQKKRTYIYRLVMDNCMEKAIFNRQISKHGLQQRVVDDAKVDANVTQSELETLLMYDEAQDVIHDEWDVSKWELDDPVLKAVTERHSRLLSAEPFLHESLILERESDLSAEEKKEAQVMFDRERARESTRDAIDMIRNSMSGISQVPPQALNSQWVNPMRFSPPRDMDINPPPLRSAPMASQLLRSVDLRGAMPPGGMTMATAMANNMGFFPSPQMMQPPMIDPSLLHHFQQQASAMNGPVGQMPPGLMQQPQPFIPQQFMPQGPGPGMSGMQTDNMPPKQDFSANNGQGPSAIGASPKSLTYKFSDGSYAICGKSYPGAQYVGPISANREQRIVLDRDMRLRDAAIPTREMTVYAGTEVVLLRAGNSLLMKLPNGMLLDTTNSIFTSSAADMVMLPPQPVRLHLPPPLVSRSQGDVIELD